MILLFHLIENEVKTQTFTKTVKTYNTTMIVVVAVLVFVWILWNIYQRWRENKAKKRPSKQIFNRNIKKIVKVKNELTASWLKKGNSKRIHAIGIGKLENGEFCIQVFINNSSENLFENDTNQQIPDNFRGIPLVLIKMPQASFLSQEFYSPEFTREEYKKLIRDKQEVIMGGISGANSNLNGEFGTIGYFCRKKSLLQRKSDVYMLSNSHVFADLRKGIVDEHDLIMQPSPGESAASRPIGILQHFAHPKLENDVDEANFVDAAIAKLWTNQEIHKPIIPMIGNIRGFVEKEDVELDENCRKFGRTTGFTRGKVFSIYLDIWVKFDRTGQSSFFREQFLIEHEKDFCQKFVDKGDSGSIVVDDQNYVSGLIFAGANGDIELKISPDDETKFYKTVTNYGVANPFSVVLKKLNIELL